MRINNGLRRFSSRHTNKRFHEARLVRITHGRFAIWLDPFGMLDAEVVVNLLPELGVGVDLMRRGRWPGESVILFVMSTATAKLLSEFEALPAEEKQDFVREMINHLPPRDSGPLSDEVAATAGDAVAERLDEEERTS